MYPEILAIDGNIKLIQNSGVQFVDYDALVNWKNKDRKSELSFLEKGYFTETNIDNEKSIVRLVPRISEDIEYINPVTDRVVDIDNLDAVSVKESLALYDGVWFPIPYLPQYQQPNFGPINWARARIVRVTDPIAIQEARARIQRKKQSEAEYEQEFMPNNTAQGAGLADVQGGFAGNQVQSGAQGGFAGAQGGVGGVAGQAGFAGGVAGAQGGFGGAAGQGGFGAEQAGVNNFTFKQSIAGSGGYAQVKNLDEIYYRIVFAFDTRTQDNNESIYLAPTERDVGSGINFKLDWSGERCCKFLRPVGQDGHPWVKEWANAVFNDLYRERINHKINKEDFEELQSLNLGEKHYLNLLAFLGIAVNPADVCFIYNADMAKNNSAGYSSQVINVSLILDVGNSRTCGIMIEDHHGSTRSDDDFSDTYVLNLRDLNTPEQIYQEPFASRIEFARPNFDYDNHSARSTRNNAFEWPSMVRVGNEAQILSAHRKGNEGLTGLSSPKRYLWNTEPLPQGSWQFNSFSYQYRVPKKKNDFVERAYHHCIARFFNSHGNALFALDPDDYMVDNTQSLYSNSSTMTFMFIEILLHAMSQMNSVAQRNECSSKDCPRRLKHIIITTPPGMPAEEKEIYRSCVYQAIGALWKALGFDRSNNDREFRFKEYTNKAKRTERSFSSEPSAIANMNQDLGSNLYGSQQNSLQDGALEQDQDEQIECKNLISPPVPEVFMGWNEAEAGQVVYIYNESQKTFKGDCQAFIRNLRREQFGARLGEQLFNSERQALLSARIASLDIGGGTTDLVIKDYTFLRDVRSHEADIIPHEVLRDGSRLAGDDVVHDLIRECIIPQFAAALEYHQTNFNVVLNDLVGDGNKSDVNDKVKRSLFTQQILVQLAYKILFHLEHLDPFATNCTVSGTIREFLEDREINYSLAPTIKRMGPCTPPSNEVIEYADLLLGKYLPNFSLLNFYLTFDIVKINQAMISGRKFNLTRILNKFGEVLSTFNCDLLLLTGRTSKLPAVREFLLQRLNMPASRIIAMHAYRCGSWYPYKSNDGLIGDPKTTAAVGALICHMRMSHNKCPNFRFYSYPEANQNMAHYVGIIDNANMIADDAVLYRYDSAQLIARSKRTDAQEEESNFVPYKRQDDSFTTMLSVEIGYRLLDDPNFEATPLYKIEAYNDINQIPDIQKLNSMSFPDLDRESIFNFMAKLDEDIENEYKGKIQSLLDQLEALPSQQESMLNEEMQNLRNYYENEAVKQFVEPTGLRALFGAKNQVKQEREAWIAQQVAQVQTEIEQSVQSEIDRLSDEYNDQLYEQVSLMIEANTNKLKSDRQTKLEKLKYLLNVEREEFKVTLRVCNRDSPYPVPFIRANEPYLKPVETFKLERVETKDGLDRTKFFRMYLKTTSGGRVVYFMDSGVIDINGISARVIL